MAFTASLLASRPAALSVRAPARAGRATARRPAGVRAALASPEGGVSRVEQPYDRVFNFSAGPAMLPVDVLEEAQRDLLNWKGSGMSVMEMSHRGKDFMSIASKAEEDLRALMGIPDNYKVKVRNPPGWQQATRAWPHCPLLPVTRYPLQ